MAVPQEKIFWTVDEYFEFEKTSEVRHEYVDGQIYAMAGERKRHNLLAGELFNRLSAHLAETECSVYFESVKLYTSTIKYYYPDVVVTCDDDDDDEFSVKNPCLIIEVLSPSTERIDRAEKLIAYQEISSVQECALVSSERIWIQIYRRTDGDNWTVAQFMDLSDAVRFDSIDLAVTVKDIYRSVRFESKTL